MQDTCIFILCPSNAEHSTSKHTPEMRTHRRATNASRFAWVMHIVSDKKCGAFRTDTQPDEPRSHEYVHPEYILDVGTLERNDTREYTQIHVNETNTHTSDDGNILTHLMSTCMHIQDQQYTKNKNSCWWWSMISHSFAPTGRTLFFVPFFYGMLWFEWFHTIVGV